MFSQRSILYILVVLCLVRAHSADGSDALERYNARLGEISRSYNQQFAEIRKNQRAPGSEKATIRSTEQEIEQLGRMRSAAIAEAKLIYDKERQERKRTDVTPPARRSGEQRQQEFWAARLQAVEDGQKAFWDRVARDEPGVAEVRAARLEAIAEQQSVFWAGLPLREAQNAVLMAARRQAVEEAQTAFWAELFEPPVTTTPHERGPISASGKGASDVGKQANTQAQQKNKTMQLQYAGQLAAAD
jgi:hypothetical protein